MSSMVPVSGHASSEGSVSQLGCREKRGGFGPGIKDAKRPRGCSAGGQQHNSYSNCVSCVIHRQLLHSQLGSPNMPTRHSWVKQWVKALSLHHLIASAMDTMKYILPLHMEVLLIMNKKDVRRPLLKICHSSCYCFVGRSVLSEAYFHVAVCIVWFRLLMVLYFITCFNPTVKQPWLLDVGYKGSRSFSGVEHLLSQRQVVENVECPS